MRKRSFFSTFSLGRKSESSQKRHVAKKDLRQNKPIGEIRFAFARLLHPTRFIPNIRYAEKQAICPVSRLFDFIFFLKVQKYTIYPVGKMITTLNLINMIYGFPVYVYLYDNHISGFLMIHSHTSMTDHSLSYLIFRTYRSVFIIGNILKSCTRDLFQGIVGKIGLMCRNKNIRECHKSGYTIISDYYL